jgi:hypothetical protein
MTAIGSRVQRQERQDRSVARERRRLIGGAALLCLVALLAACGPFLPPETQRPGAGPSGAPAVSPAPTFAGNPEDRLAAALTALSDGYTFETTLRIGEQLAARVVGRRLGNASELVIESGGASVTYRIVPPASWLREEGGEWVEADGTAPSGDPLAPLLAPGSVAAVPGPAGTDRLSATYPAAALGLVSGDPVTVAISIAPDGTVTARYETVVDASQGVSETVLRPAPSQDPIVAPSPLPSPEG